MDRIFEIIMDHGCRIPVIRRRFSEVKWHILENEEHFRAQIHYPALEWILQNHPESEFTIGELNKIFEGKEQVFNFPSNKLREQIGTTPEDEENLRLNQLARPFLSSRILVHSRKTTWSDELPYAYRYPHEWSNMKVKLGLKPGILRALLKERRDSH